MGNGKWRGWKGCSLSMNLQESTRSTIKSWRNGNGGKEPRSPTMRRRVTRLRGRDITEHAEVEVNAADAEADAAVTGAAGAAVNAAAGVAASRAAGIAANRRRRAVRGGPLR